MHLQQSRPINDKYAIVDSQLLGKGSTGNVYLGFLLINPQAKVAIKAINLKEIDNEVTRYLLSCEIAALSNLGKIDNTAHENIVRLLDVVLQENYIYLVTELLEGGTLGEYLKKASNGLPEDEVMLIFRQILQAYKAIRNKGITHRDLKPDNILFKSKPEISKKIAIIDFGYCEMNEVPNKPQMFYNVGSPKYMAPEAYVDNFYSQKSDIWALGVIFYEMLMGKTCDQGLKMQTYLEMIRKNGIPLPNHLSTFFKHILSKMLNYNHQARFDCLQIFKELENYQASLQLYHSQATQLPSNQFNESVPNNDFFNLRSGRNNPVFKSAMMGQSPQLLPNAIQANIIVHEVPTNIPPQQRNENFLSEKRVIKSNSTRNVTNKIAFNVPNGNILEKVENVYQRPKNKIVQMKSNRPNMQTLSVQPLVDVSFQTPKVHFKMVPSQPNQREVLHTPNQSPHDQQQNARHQREQRYPSNNQFDQNSIKILIKSAHLDQRFQTVPHQPMMSIEKAYDNRIMHSPERKPSGQPKVHFFTEQKMKEKDDAQKNLRHVIDVRPFHGEVRRGVHNSPVLGLTPLFH